MNDSGKWMYYENGKPVTGKKTIDDSTYTLALQPMCRRTESTVLTQYKKATTSR